MPTTLFMQYRKALKRRKLIEAQQISSEIMEFADFQPWTLKDEIIERLSLISIGG